MARSASKISYLRRKRPHMRTDELRLLNGKVKRYFGRLIPEREGIYKDPRRNPELSQEFHVSAGAAHYLETHEYNVTTNVGTIGGDGTDARVYREAKKYNTMKTIPVNRLLQTTFKTGMLAMVTASAWLDEN